MLTNEQIIAEYLAGRTASSIAKEIGHRSHHGVMKIIRMNGVPAHPRSERHKAAFPYTPTQFELRGQPIFRNGKERFFYFWEYRGRATRRPVARSKCHICGKEIWVDGRPRTRRNTCSTECRNEIRRGVHKPAFTGIKSKSSGYILTYQPDHPYAVKNYVNQHRLVVEKRIGRVLEPTEAVHHKNFEKTDNQDSNLVLMTRKQHQWLHSQLSVLVAKLYGLGIVRFNEDTMLYEVGER